ncbi:hypothetical protein [Anaerotignum propionicum]|uniref:Uncharacterized protein n=1 Tax=Anaerotignum propionicum DSM 1682 TaxID=991789 RepID=A0A0X1U996_ANAPI|nr:hypothetical protein [Anaerotignum propionicum]AMJ41530.1 hypothetical protein CPRO_19480 [Anaerotignum propionicum DSM 1682]SHE70661.1 hypothetical protein SAMN02745151_01548 [[Clostridium] propionicum DSM 1682] [Anaerotignum propionicum DSM 1682]
MKKCSKTSVALTIILSLLVSTTAFAVGDGNIDAGGGGMDNGTSVNVWSPGNDGVRVTVVRASDYTVVTTPIDLTNKSPNNIQMHFGKVSKIQYSEGVGLTPLTSKYRYINPPQSMPTIISDKGNSNIDAIKKYFCSEYIVQMIANHTGMNYDILIGGEYKLLLEPIAYYKFEGVMIATTATEAAMYDEQISGLLRRRMVALSHQNLPLAMFLEVSDLGYPAWKGSTSKAASNADIKSSLGLGVVRFTELPESPEIVTQDYEYRVNTEVITAVTVSGGQSDPDNPTRVTFSIDGRTYNVGNVYYPEGDSQLAWVKWTTPDIEQDMVIHVSVEGPGGTDKTTIHCKIVDLDKNPPPNPIADDRNDTFLPVSVPKRAEMTRADWSVWDPWWQEYWVWHGDDEDGYWCDHGWWEFDLDKYYARFSANMNIRCDSKNPTASGGVMKSGYGINETVTASVSSNQSSAITYPQTAVSYFPEFGYETYWRLLDRMKDGSSTSFEFQNNKYSTYKNRTHFTPIWMPDGNYTVNTWAADSWTPVGMLSMNLTDSLTIKGNLWQDWHVAPLKP